MLLPPGAVFVVANSLAVSNKAESATKHYNLRVVECRWVRRAREPVGGVRVTGNSGKGRRRQAGGGELPDWARRAIGGADERCRHHAGAAG